MPSENWEIEAEKGRKILRDSIPEQWLLPADKLPDRTRLNVLGVAKESGLLSEKELAITASDATRLVQMMGAGNWTAKEVTIAFLKRATIGHQLLNMATEFMVEDAIAQAEALDEYFMKNKKLIGPLHGVPISTKEHVWHKGRIANAGYVAYVDNRVFEDAHIVQLAKKAGAVFHLRTNEPQTLMTGETNNNITGQTMNGSHMKLSTGGSSGGEGASIAFKGSAIGLGTDIGGSIRIPAAFNGVYGFRPTTSRLPYDGIELPGAGQESIKCVIGPLTRSVNDIDLLMKTILDQEPWDTELSLVPLPWKKVESSKDITVGIMWSDGIVHPHPPMQRALRVVNDKLKAAGVNTVDWEPYKSMEILEIIAALFFPDGAALQKSILAQSGEPMNTLSQSMLSIGRELTIPENWTYNDRRDKLRSEFHNLFKQRNVDVIICPPYPGSACLQNTTDYGTYTMLWNCLDLPALVFPTGLVVDEELDPVEEGYRPQNEFDRVQFEKYNPQTFAGAPLCLQLVGKHFHDEATVAAARMIEEIIHA